MGNQMTEMLKGTLEGIVLAVLARRSAYGYEITAWLRERCAAEVSRVELVPSDLAPSGCVSFGQQLAAQFESVDVGLLILGDGSTRHGPRSPGSDAGC